MVMSCWSVNVWVFVGVLLRFVGCCCWFEVFWYCMELLGVVRVICGVEWEIDGYVDGSCLIQYQYYFMGVC